MRISLYLIILLSLNSCFIGEVKEDIYKGFSPKMLFDGAKYKSGNGEFEESLTMYQELQARYPASKYSLQSKLEVPFTLYKSEKYNDAIKNLNDYIKLYPNHESTPYAYYLRGLISKQKSSSFLDEINITDSASRDTQSVKDAFNYYFELIKKFPNSKYSIEAKSQLITLKNILARHELFVAIFYTKRPAPIAAINRCKYIIEKYPNTPSVPAALHLLAHNYDNINKKTLAADTRRVLEKSYPKYTPHYSLK
jgi:outer membrane protein assembly factor BamD